MIKNIWKDPVWSKVISTGIIAIFAAIGTYLVGAWPYIDKMLIQIWTFLTSTTPIQNWALGLMAIPSSLLILAVIIEIKDRITPKKPQHDFKSYTQDNFFGILWHWQYSGNQINNIYSLCPHCKYQILPRDKGISYMAQRHEYTCDDCGYSAGIFEEEPYELDKKVRLKVQQALRTGEWTKKITNINRQ